MSDRDVKTSQNLRTRKKKKMTPSPSFENLSFERLAWAALFYHNMENYDEPYRELLQKSEIILTLRTNPNNLLRDQVKDNIIKGFLLRWGCRPLQATDKLAECIIEATIKIQNSLQWLNDKKLIDLDLAGNDNAIKDCYQTMVNIRNGFSHTAASKFLHVISPELFVIWDGPMRKHYKKYYDIAESAEGYFEYMKQMKEDLIQKVLPSFSKANNECPAAFLSEKLKIDPPKTLVKYLDEYNWITITKKVILPPPWHP